MVSPNVLSALSYSEHTLLLGKICSLCPEICLHQIRSLSVHQAIMYAITSTVQVHLKNYNSLIIKISLHRFDLKRGTFIVNLTLHVHHTLQ